MHFHRFFASGRLARTKVFDIWHHQLAKFSYIRVGHRSFKSSRPFLFALVPVFSIAIFCHETPTNMKIHEEENNSSILARRKEENTGLLFNSILSLSNSAENSQSVLYELMAVGARQITFLKFNVYGIGLYATPASIADIKSKIESERESFSLQSKDRLLDEILDLQLDLTLEIVPARNTTGSHMRDGIARFLTQRLIQAKLSSEEEQQIYDGIQSLKILLPKSTIPFGTRLAFRRTRDGQSLLLYLNGDFQGEVHQPWIAHMFFKAYLVSHPVISPTLQTNYCHYLISLAKE